MWHPSLFQIKARGSRARIGKCCFPFISEANFPSSDGHEEGEFRAGAAPHADEDRAQNSGTGTGGAGDQAQALEAADEHGSFQINIVH